MMKKLQGPSDWPLKPQNRGVESYHLSYDDVIDSIDIAFSENDSFCQRNVDVRYGIDPKTDDGITEFDPRFPIGSIGYSPIEVFVGVKSLEARKLQSGRVRDDDAVRSIFAAYHESAHVWQYTTGYMQKRESAPRELSEMAKGRAVGIAFPEYYTRSYLIDSSELFADRYAAIKTSMFFKEAQKERSEFGDVDADGIICGMMVAKYGDAWPKMQNCKSIDDIEHGLTDAMAAAPYRNKFDLGYLESRKTLNPCTEKLLFDKETVSKILSARSGVEETEALCEYVGKNYPSCFHSLPCIRDDYCQQNLKGYGDKIISSALQMNPQPWKPLPGDVEFGN